MHYAMEEVVIDEDEDEDDMAVDEHGENEWEIW